MENGHIAIQLLGRDTGVLLISYRDSKTISLEVGALSPQSIDLMRRIFLDDTSNE